MTKVYDTATDLITFARSSSGTALRRVGYGENLVTDFSTYADQAAFDEDWTRGIGWTFDANNDTAIHAAGSATLLTQSISMTLGKVYQATCDVVACSGGTGSLQFRLGGTTTSAIIDVTDVGSSVQVTYVADGNTQVAVFAGSGTDLTIDNISVKEVIFDRATDPLVLYNHPDGMPRIEYGSDGSLKGLLIEEQRTNLVTYSEDFSNAAWDKVGTVAIDSTLVTGPDGTLSGRRVLNFDDAAGDRLVELVSITNATLTGSVWVKGEGDNIGKDIQLTAKRAGGTFAGTTVSHTLTADWERIYASFTQDPANTGANIVLANPANGNEASEVLVYGAQLEEGSFPTSYIPTSGSQQTRSADLASIPVSAFGYNQDAGTLVVEAQTVANQAAIRRVLSLDDGVTVSNSIQIAVLSGGTTIYLEARDDVTLQVSGATGAVSSAAPFRVAYAFAANDYAASVDGGALFTDTTASVPTEMTQLGIGSYVSGSSTLNGHIKSIQYYPRRLTNTQLQELTS